MITNLDAEIINRTYDLLPVVEGDTQLTREGAWYIGPCPFCRGRDRFNLKQTPDGWKWFCRHCGEGRYHTAVDYIIRREQVSFLDALKRMAPEAPAMPEREKQIEQLAENLRVPPPAWRFRAAEYVETCRQNLWKPCGAAARKWLHERGMLDWTLTKYRIGFHPVEEREPLAAWGLDGEAGQQVFLARGITLPAVGPVGVDYIKTRLAVAPGTTGKKYIKVRGSKPGVFGWANMRGAWLAVVTEGEFDAMICDQQAGDMAAVCTFGSATDSPLNVDADLLRWYATAAYTCLAFDNDEQGHSGALSFQEKLPKALALSLPEGSKDLNEMYLAGIDLADWLARETERLGIDQAAIEGFGKR